MLRDEFAWLKAENWQEVLREPEVLPDEVRAHLVAENAYADAFLDPLAETIADLTAEMRARIREDDLSVPHRHGAFLYYTRQIEGGQHPLICRRAGEEDPEVILLDCDALSRQSDYFDLGAAEHAPDHRLLAWSSDTSGAEYYTVCVRDLATLADLPVRIERTDGNIAWYADGARFLYVTLDDNHRPRDVRRHVIGTRVDDDVVVFTSPDPGFFLNLSVTQSHAYAMITVKDHETSEVWLVDLSAEDRAPVRVAPRRNGLQYTLDHGGGPLAFIRTNADGAEDFKIVAAPLSSPAPALWQDVVPHRPGIMIVSMHVFAGHLVRLEREDARPRIVIRRLSDGAEHAIAFDEEAYSLWIDAGLEAETNILRFGYSSMTTPSEIHDYDMDSRERRLRKRQDIPSGHNPADYVTRRLLVPAADGETIPVSLLHHRTTKLDGSAPCLLYGYGSYGISIPASFSANRLSLVDRGFVYAIAHVRGGTEKGWRWYTSGKRAAKRNTFTDFIAAAEGLIEAGYTAKGHIVGHGGSAGGMLMGAVANMAPELFAGIVADVPFVDVMNTMLDASLPLTPPEWPEWGNPAEDAAAFEAILSYSPYDNVRAQHYPAILALAGITDPRVTYWEPAKWVARLRATMTGGGPILLRTNMSAGHGGASGRFDHLKEVAMIYTFALKVTEQVSA